MQTIGFIGGGNMAEALIKGIIAAKIYPPENILASDISSERLDYLTAQYRIKAATDNAQLTQQADICLLCVKPQNMTEALNSIKGHIDPAALIISIAAGITVANITAILGDVPIVRVMPNTPALIGEGASALFANDLAKPLLRKAQTIFASVGKAVFVEDEDLIDAVTAVSGSGPAYFFLMIEEMINAAIEIGLEPEIAEQLVLQTAKGSALLAAESARKGQTPAELRKKVTSPGGTTEAAIKSLEEANFAQILTKAIKRAREKSKQLSK